MDTSERRVVLTVLPSTSAPLFRCDRYAPAQSRMPCPSYLMMSLLPRPVRVVIGPLRCLLSQNAESAVRRAVSAARDLYWVLPW